MKSHTSEFKEEIKTLGKQQSVRITYTLNNEQIILTDEDMSLKQEMENKHNSELRVRLESEFKELKNELHDLQDDVKDLKRLNHSGGGFNANTYVGRRNNKIKDDYDRDWEI